MITFPQIKNTGLIVVAIVLVSAALGVSNAFLHGEIKEWADLGEAASDSLLYAVAVAVGWIALKSPLAKEVTGILTQESESTTTAPSGAVTVEKSKTSLETTAPVSEGK